MRRTPLNRNTPLRARAGLKRTPMRRRSSAMPATPKPRRRRKPAADETAWQAAREAIYHRAAGRCERCGDSLDSMGMDAHHRKLRSRGGTDELSNLVALCPDCHRTVHAHPAIATGVGWMVSSTTDPMTVPITLHTHRVVRLDNTGTYTEGCAA